MEHYTVEKWIDFARNLIGAPEKAAMQRHLDGGCKKCSKVMSLWRHVHEVARQESALEPPESAIRAIKGTFAIHGPRARRSAPRAIAKLLFDSALSPAQVGVRSSASAARQFLFGIGAYRIDLRMEPQVDSDKVALIGQVLHSTDTSEGLGELPVALVKGRKVVAETRTNEFGEFNLECDLDGPFHLRVKLPAEELQLALIEPTLPPGRLQPLPYDSNSFNNLVQPKKKRTKGRY